MPNFIRKAMKHDADQIAPLIFDAIGEIANRLTGESNHEKVIEQLKVLFNRTDNRHSYLNTYVIVEEKSQDILGILVLYSGEEGLKLDVALQDWLKNKNAPITNVDVEAYSDELYIDTICVHENCRGLGIGTKLLYFAEEIAIQEGFSKLSLNVEIEKSSARELYERIGYVITEPWTIINEPFYHMVKTING